VVGSHEQSSSEQIPASAAVVRGTQTVDITRAEDTAVFLVSGVECSCGLPLLTNIKIDRSISWGGQRVSAWATVVRARFRPLNSCDSSGMDRLGVSNRNAYAMVTGRPCDRPEKHQSADTVDLDQDLRRGRIQSSLRACEDRLERSHSTLGSRWMLWCMSNLNGVVCCNQVCCGHTIR
jgi:hypothetical protein